LVYTIFQKYSPTTLIVKSLYQKGETIDEMVWWMDEKSDTQYILPIKMSAYSWSRKTDTRNPQI